ncbi:unannotated protein [freshwater metagenome]|uniref:Unannotated protein n=1 Tax=freshwater metagenome TaxID=449393 RepID=A0A6J7J4P4_9ZZZZ
MHQTLVGRQPCVDSRFEVNGDALLGGRTGKNPQLRNSVAMWVGGHGVATVLARDDVSQRITENVTPGLLVEPGDLERADVGESIGEVGAVEHRTADGWIPAPDRRSASEFGRDERVSLRQLYDQLSLRRSRFRAVQQIAHRVVGQGSHTMEGELPPQRRRDGVDGRGDTPDMRATYRRLHRTSESVTRARGQQMQVVDHQQRRRRVVRHQITQQPPIERGRRGVREARQIHHPETQRCRLVRDGVGNRGLADASRTRDHQDPPVLRRSGQTRAALTQHCVAIR